MESTAHKIQKMLIDKDMRKVDVAKYCGWSPSSFYNRLKSDDFRESDLRKIAAAMDCDLVLEFVPRKTTSEDK